MTLADPTRPARLVVNGHPFDLVQPRAEAETLADRWRDAGFIHVAVQDVDHAESIRQRLRNILALSENWTAARIEQAIINLSARIEEEHRVNHLV